VGRVCVVKLKPTFTHDYGRKSTRKNSKYYLKDPVLNGKDKVKKMT